MLELIAIIILFGSFLGMTVILFQKIPVLEKMPIPEAPQERLSFQIKSKTKDLFSSFSPESILHKFLLKFKILILKTENKTSQLLKKLQKRAVEKQEENDNDDYWKELKKAKRDED